MKQAATYRILYLLVGLLLMTATPLRADDNDILDRLIQLSKSKGTIYKLLGEVSERTGYLFIYDSKIINNEQIVKVPGGKYSVREAIYRITGDTNLSLRVIGNHILISCPVASTPVKEETPVPADTIPYFTLEGLLRDKFTNDPIPYATVSVSNGSIGSVTNQGGEFRLRLPDSLRLSQISFSHIGYQPLEVESSLLAERYSMLTLEPKVISLQEVVVRIVNPIKLLKEMQDKRFQNYPQKPAFHTSFYREGIERKNRFVSLTEGVFKIYKSSYSSIITDQVKLLKMRRITNNQEKDTIVAKMKSGIYASLQLDLMKDMPEFLIPESEINYPYVYAHSDITVVDDRIANVISFEQREFINEPLFRGNLYVDSENSALLKAEFEINPKYVKNATGMLVEKKSRNLKITPQKVVYTVSYKPWNGTYYINHVRGDLYFKIKKKKQLFGSSPLHIWFEMVTCKIDTVDVSRFGRKEMLPTRTIFSDTKFRYDAGFWENFNVIPPEEKLNEAINKISSQIEETGYY